MVYKKELIFVKKLKSNGLVTFLAIASILGFVLATIELLTEFSLNFNYVGIVLGVGFIVESQFLRTIRRKKFSSDLIMKIVTFVVGVFVLAGGLWSIFGSIPDKLIGAFIMTNVIAIFVIIIELFFID